MKSNHTPLLILVTTLLLGACTSAPREAAPSSPAHATTTASKDNPKNLRKGMTEAEIRTVWGEPKAIHADKEGGVILVYHFDLLTTQRMVAASMTEVPTFDPISGETRSVMEPVLAPQNVTVTQTIVLQLKEGKLAGWARQLGEQRSFN
jgi:hypothetical protein